MYKTLVFSKRNLKELTRDMLTLVFTILLPIGIFLIMMFLVNQLNIPNSAFEIENFTPAIIIFSFSFLTLFTAILVSKDKSTSFLTRLFVSPLKSHNYVLGYMLPIIVISLVQNILIFIVAILFGLNLTWNIFLVILATIPVAIIFSGLGLILGSILTDKQAPGITSILIQVVAFTSGMWFDLDMIGGAYKTISYILPFSHSVDLLKYLLAGEFSKITMPLIVVLTYGLLFVLIAILTFKKNSFKK